MFQSIPVERTGLVDVCNNLHRTHQMSNGSFKKQILSHPVSKSLPCYPLPPSTFPPAAPAPPLLTQPTGSDPDFRLDPLGSSTIFLSCSFSLVFWPINELQLHLTSSGFPTCHFLLHLILAKRPRSNQTCHFFTLLGLCICGLLPELSLLFYNSHCMSEVFSEVFPELLPYLPQSNILPYLTHLFITAHRYLSSVSGNEHLETESYVAKS